MNPYAPNPALSSNYQCVLNPEVRDALARCCAESSANIASNSIYHVFSDPGTGAVSGRVITPILAELIDTPAFEVKRSVPFLEVSLHAKLAKDFSNLTTDWRDGGVNSEPLLVANGAAALNGAVEGYKLVYSTVPGVEAPPCDLHTAYLVSETSLSVLLLIRNGLMEAWSEYYTYKMRSIKCAESDIVSLKAG